MKVSELISKLQECMTRYGDLSVTVRDIVKGEVYDICSIGAYTLEAIVQIEI